MIAPYATGLAAMVDGEAALANFAALADLGARGRLRLLRGGGLHREPRCPRAPRKCMVRAYMAHHQGMSIVAIANALLDGRMRERFHSDVSVQATELLLQERTPRDVSVAHPRAEEVGTAARVADLQVPQVRRLRSPHDSAPQTHLLSNGRYSVMITAAGSGYSRWNDLAITRWREDATRDDTGSYLLLRDVETRPRVVGGLPALRRPAGQLRSELHRRSRRDHSHRRRHRPPRSKCRCRPEDDAEVRLLSIDNGSIRTREIEVTRMPSWCSAPQSADVAHPAFSKMFVRTEFLARQKAADCAPPAPRSRRTGGLGFASRRGRRHQHRRTRSTKPIARDSSGRGRELRAPLAMLEGRALSGTAGTVLDAVFALRYRLQHSRGRHGAHRLLDLRRGRPRDICSTSPTSIAIANARTRRATLAWTQAQVQLRHFGIDASQANLFQQLAGHILFAGAAARASADNHPARRAPDPRDCGRRASPATCPSCCCGSKTSRTCALVRQLLQAHEYWGIKRLSVDLVILNERGASYIQDLQVALEAAVRISLARPRIAGTDTRGKVFVLRTDLVTTETRALLLAVARVVSVGPARQPRRPDRTHAARPHRGTAIAAANAGRGRGHCRIRKSAASWSSSTASAASPRRAANT